MLHDDSLISVHPASPKCSSVPTQHPIPSRTSIIPDTMSATGPGEPLSNPENLNSESDATSSGQPQQDDGRKGISVSVIDPLSRKVVRGLASGIGLAAEIYHHHKEKQATEVNINSDGEENPQNPPLTPGQSNNHHRDNQDDDHNDLDTYYSSSIPQQMHEATWELDEAQYRSRHGCNGSDEPPQDSPLSVSETQLPQLAESFLQSHPSSLRRTVRPPELPLPVLITQRRPGKRSRGFIRAYPPLLDDVGIDQATFLDFIDTLNKAVQPSGLIQALNLASIAGFAAPDHFAVLVAIAVQVATDMGDEIHSRVKTSSFLDKMNSSFFAPRGLVALVMTWKPSRPGEMLTMASFETSSVAASAAASSDTGGFKKLKHKLDPSNGVSFLEWAETAPLIFPGLDELAADGGQAKKQNALERSSTFIEEYLDRRARARWAGRNPQNAVANAGPQDTFKSRYSDPNHLASSGDPLALVTGGRVQFPSLRVSRGGRPDGESAIGGSGRQSPSGGGQGLRRAGTGVLPLLSGGLTLLQKVSW